MNPYAQQKSGSARWVTRLAWSLFSETIRTCARAESPFGSGKGVNFFSHMYASQSWLGWTSDAVSWDNLSPYERDLSEGGWVLASVLLHVLLDLSLNSAVADPGGGGGADPLKQTEAPRAEKNFFGDRAPRYLRVWMTTRSGSGTAQSIQIKTKNERRSPISHHLDLSLTHLYVLKSDKENQGVQEKK